MQRRSASHNYTAAGFYHVTMSVDRKQGPLLGCVAGEVGHPDGHPEAPRVVLTPVGTMVEQELQQSISAHYPMVLTDTYVVMPDHVHVLLNVTGPLFSRTGKPVHLGQVIAGFKKGCNRRFWALTQQGEPAATAVSASPSATAVGGSPADIPASPAPTVVSGSPALTVVGGSPADIPALPSGKKRAPSTASTGRPPLFAYGYCDVMPVDAAQLAQQRAYIKGNPRSRLLRSSHPDWLQPRRRAFTTALTISALRGYLQRECPALAAVGASPALTAVGGSPADIPSPTAVGGSPAAILLSIERRLLTAGAFVALDTYGNRALLERRLLPVVCHRRDKARLVRQKARCLEEAAQGAVLVSARIAKGEQEIMDAAASSGYPVILISDNGYPDIYHPSTAQLDRCAAGRLLLVTPWSYQYRRKDDPITVPFCKTMNCIAQAICRLKDTWWQ